jgi:hypothetical protein
VAAPRFDYGNLVSQHQKSPAARSSEFRAAGKVDPSVEAAARLPHALGQVELRAGRHASGANRPEAAGGDASEARPVRGAGVGRAVAGARISAHPQAAVDRVAGLRIHAARAGEWGAAARGLGGAAVSKRTLSHRELSARGCGAGARLRCAGLARHARGATRPRGPARAGHASFTAGRASLPARVGDAALTGATSRAAD